MISIAMATYNGEKFIRQQIESILSQTINDFELIICDDCSNDSTVEIIQEYLKKDSRIKIFQNSSNLGFKKNFEAIISHCSGEYIAFCDQDDIWTNDHLEILLNNLDGNLLICGNAELVDENGKTLNLTTEQCYEIPANLNSQNALSYLLHTNFCQGTASLISRELLKKAYPIPDEIAFHDWWFALIASLSKKAKYIDNVILYYRQHDSTVTKSAKWSIVDAVKKHKENRHIFKDKCNDRLIYIKNIFNIAENQDAKETIVGAWHYYQNFLDNKYSVNKKYFRTHYKYLYWSGNSNIFIYVLRFIKIFWLHL